MDKRELEELLKLKKALDIIGMKKCTDTDFGVMKLVSNELYKMKVKRPLISETKYPRDQIIGTGISTLKIYDSTVAERTHEIFTSSPFLLMKNQGEFNTNVIFSIEKDENGNYIVDKESGQVNHFKISVKSCLSDIIWYAHEGIHACKEIKYNEYINACRYSDVIPLFHELVTSLNVNKTIFDEWIKTRFYFLQKNIEMINETLKLKEKDKENNDLYGTKIGGNGQYLISYYYATILFDMYLKNSTLILDMINKVLKGEKTTEEILTELNIINPTDDLNNSFYSVNKQFQKLLRR